MPARERPRPRKNHAPSKTRAFGTGSNYRLGTDISSKVLAFAFALTAEIERNLVSQRTKEALARKRLEGVTLGRPKGRKSSYVKLTGKEKDIMHFLQKGWSKIRIARRMKVHRITLSNFIKGMLNPGHNG